MESPEEAGPSVPQSADELIRRYQSGERYFGQCELEEPICDFRGVDLSEADFRGSFLVADFREANLRSTNFTGCNVKTCDFRGADLRNAIFREAALEATEFAGANLAGADFEGAGCYSYRMNIGELPDW